MADVHVVVQQALWEHSRISVHHGKTQIWNKAGEEPRGWRALTAAAPLLDPEAVVWRGGRSLPPSAQGVKVLGTPLGHPDFVRAHLRSSTEAQRVLMQRIPSIPDLQGAWLLLLFCAGTICSGWCHQTWRLISLLSTTLRCGSASAKSWDVKCQLAFLDRRVGLAERSIKHCSLLG